MSGIRYRMAGVEDAATLQRLFAQSFVETFGHLYRPEDLAAFLNGADEAAWREELSEPDLAVRLVEAEGEAVAFAKVSPVGLPVEVTRPSLELRQLYVLKPWQGSGIAVQLMEWALGEAKRRQAKDVYLTVFSENHRARRFYERYGFRFVGPYAFMVGEQADEDHILKLELED